MNMRPSGSEPRIAIVVPAYKSAFLPELLESLARQSDMDFKVFVGDDASPDDLSAVCDRFADTLRIEYRRFADNLGGANLAAQWNRCIRCVDAEWILMPGDDDVLDSRCIEQFRAAVTATDGRFAAYRGTLIRTDAGGRELSRGVPEQFSDTRAKVRLAGAEPAMVIEYLFSAERLLAIGGFVSFPLGWFSDNATWIRLAASGGIRGVPEAMIYGRMSDINISSYSPSTHLTKLEATVRFIEWIESNRNDLGLDQRFLDETFERFSGLLAFNSASKEVKPPLRTCLDWARRLSRLTGHSAALHLYRLQRAIWASRVDAFRAPRKA